MGVRSSIAFVARVLQAVVEASREERVTLAAAGLAYYLLLFFVPLGLLVLVGLAETGHLVAATNWLDGLTKTPISTARLRRLTGGPGGSAAREHAAAIAVVLVAWSAVRAFRSLNVVFGDVSDREEHGDLVTELVEVGVVVVTTVGVIALSALATAEFAYTTTDTLWFFSVPVLLFCGFFCLFLPVYYVFPPADVTLAEAVPGTLLAASVWTVSGILIRFYAEGAESVDLYGVVGVALLLMTWFYVGGLAVLTGIVLNGVLRGAVDVDV